LKQNHKFLMHECFSVWKQMLPLVASMFTLFSLTGACLAMHYNQALKIIYQ
jgi:hypothetical protein